MSKVCQVTGKKPSVGHNVSHSMRHTKRRFLPNLLKKRVFNPITGLFVTLKTSAKGLKCLTKSPHKFFKQISK